MFSFSNKTSLVAVVAVFMNSCGIQRAAETPRTFVKEFEPDVYYSGDEIEESQKYIDYASSEISACGWQNKLAKEYSSSTGRFRLMGEVEMRKPPKEPSQFSLIFIIKSLISVVEFFMPWNWFNGVENPKGLDRIPWGRVDMKGHSLYSYALISEAGNSIPNREEFKEKVKEALTKNPAGYAKLLAFRIGLITGAINADEKRDEVVVAEIEKVFPGIFSQDEHKDMSESLPWVLARNGLRKITKITTQELNVYSQKLPVFRSGSWGSFSDDMSRGLGAAISGMYSNESLERACASNIIFRASEQFLQLMGQETIALYDVGNAQSYIPSLAHLTGGGESPKIRHCDSAGSIVKNGRRTIITEKILRNFSKYSATYDWSDSPVALQYCKPEPGESATGMKSKSSERLASMLNRMEAFGHYIFAFNPNASWWLKTGRYPLGDFSSLKDIQDSRTVAPAKIHTLALAFLQMDLIHLQERHLVLLNEFGVRTLNQDEALGIRLSEFRLTPESLESTSTLSSALHFVSLLTKFDRYLASLEDWDVSNRSANWRKVDLFGSVENFNLLLGDVNRSNRELIQKLYLASSLMLTKFINEEDSSSCHDLIQTNLVDGNEVLSGECGALKQELSRSLATLAQKLHSALLQRKARELMQ